MTPSDASLSSDASNSFTTFSGAPGIYLTSSKGSTGSTHESFGPYSAYIKGRLSSRVQKGPWTLLMDGIFVEKPFSSKSDTEYALDLFLKEGIEAIQKINGFFNILILREGGKQIHFISDLLCSRPWYLYQNKSTVALAPTPLAFASENLDMTINPQALYEQIRLLHTGYDRTLVKEVQRILPGHAYQIGTNVQVDKKVVHRFHQNIDHSLTLDDCASWLTKVCSDSIKGVLTHPKLKDLLIQLPLTGGLDSRHLLAELISQNHPPELLRHIRVQEKDYKPTKHIADSLDIPLLASNLKDLNTIQLLKRWMLRSGGLINFHQYYLLHLKNDVPGKSAIGFNGYLMDILVGMAVKTDTVVSAEAPHKAVWERTYSSRLIRKLLIPEEKRWANETKQLFLEETDLYKGEAWFRMMMLDIHHRGLHYTGIVDTMLAEEVYSFSPGASMEAYRFASTAPHHIAGNKKARLKALQNFFPYLASFPSVEGIAVSKMETRPEIINNPFLKNAKLLLKSLKTGFRDDPAPESEHSWIRNQEDLHQIHKTIVYHSALAKDGYLNAKGLQICWNLNEIGGYQGWTLMSLLSAEVAYRLLVKKQKPPAVIEWLDSTYK